MSDLYAEFTDHLILSQPQRSCPVDGTTACLFMHCVECELYKNHAPNGDDNIKKGGNNMGYSNKAKAAEANADKVNDKNFITINDITIDRANEIKEGVVMFDIAVGHIKIYGMSMRHMTNKDGQEWDAISFPARKADNGKYYDIAWFPMSAELKAQVAEKVIDKLNS